VEEQAAAATPLKTEARYPLYECNCRSVEWDHKERKRKPYYFKCVFQKRDSTKLDLKLMNLQMSVNWEEVISILMNGTGISLDLYYTNFIIKDSDYFRDLGGLLAEFRIKDISTSYYVISSNNYSIFNIVFSLVFPIFY
jgi:hypothetical protein